MLGDQGITLTLAVPAGQDPVALVPVAYPVEEPAAGPCKRVEEIGGIYRIKQL